MAVSRVPASDRARPFPAVIEWFVGLFSRPLTWLWNRGFRMIVILDALALFGLMWAIIGVRSAFGFNWDRYPPSHYIIGFSTANRGAAAQRAEPAGLEMLPNDQINGLIAASVHATEEAILNAMLAAETLTGINGYTVPALPHDRLRTLMTRVNGALEGGGRDN